MEMKVYAGRDIYSRRFSAFLENCELFESGKARSEVLRVPLPIISALIGCEAKRIGPLFVSGAALTRHNG
jgi:hypothetical protein